MIKDGMAKEAENADHSNHQRCGYSKGYLRIDKQKVDAEEDIPAADARIVAVNSLDAASGDVSEIMIITTQQQICYFFFFIVLLRDSSDKNLVPLHLDHFVIQLTLSDEHFVMMRKKEINL